MKRQAKPLSHDLWRSSEGLAIAVDSQPNKPLSESFHAWLDGDRALLVIDGELFALEGLEPQDVAMVLSGRATVVEFSPEGPRREAPILDAEPRGLA